MKIKDCLATVIMLATSAGAGASAGATTISCQHEGAFATFYVTVRPTPNLGIFHATLRTKDKFTYSIPGEPLPIIAEYDPVFHNQHLDFYQSYDGQFSLLLGDASQPHVHAGDLNADVTCSQD